MQEVYIEEGPEARAEGQDGMRALCAALVRSRGLITLAVLAGGALGLGVGFVRPNVYRCTGKLLVRWGAREAAAPEASVAGPVRPDGGLARESVNNQLHVITDPRVYELAARALTPARVLQPYDPRHWDGPETPAQVRLFHGLQDLWFSGLGSPEPGVEHALDNCQRCVDGAVKVLKKHIEVRVEPYSNVISAAYVANEPGLARDVVAAFLEAAEKHHHEVHEIGTTLDFLDKQVDSALGEIAAAETELSDFRIECGTFDPEVQQAELLARVRELEDQVTLDQHRMAELRARSTGLTALLATVPATMVESKGHNVVPNPARAEIRERIFKLEQSLFDLGQRLGGTTRVLETERETLHAGIDALRAQLKLEPELVDLGLVVQEGANARHQRLADQLDDAKQELASSEAVAELRTQRLLEIRNRLNTVELCKPQYGFLTTRVNNARGRYQDFLTAHQRADLMKLLDKVSLSNLLRIQDASMPLEKEGPKRGKILLLGLLLGAFAGLLLAIAVNALDRRIHDEGEVERLLGLSVLGVVPRAAGSGRAPVLHRAAL